jgi:hypothetical protein
MEDFERPYKQVSRVKALALFVFRPRAFLEMASKHDIAWLLSDSPDIRASYVRGESKPNEAEMRSNAAHRTAGLRRSLLSSGLVVACSAIIAVVVGFLLRKNFGALSNFMSNFIQAVAVGVILWATLWQLTRDLQSFGGNSLPERVHSWVFSCLYTLGTFLFFVVYTWQA